MWFKDNPPEKSLNQEEENTLKKVAQKIVDNRMTVPAILFLESVKPLNFVGSQVLHFFQPFVQMLFSASEYEKFASTMERRESVERLICFIEDFDAEAIRKRKANKG